MKGKKRKKGERGNEGGCKRKDERERRRKG